MSLPLTRSQAISVYIQYFNLSETLGLVQRQPGNVDVDSVSGIPATLRAPASVTSAFNNAWCFGIPAALIPTDNNNVFDYTDLIFYQNPTSTLGNFLSNPSNLDITLSTVDGTMPALNLSQNFFGHMASTIFNSQQAAALFTNTGTITTALTSAVASDLSTVVKSQIAVVNGLNTIVYSAANSSAFTGPGNVGLKLFTAIVVNDPTTLQYLDSSHSTRTITYNGVQYMEFAIPIIEGDMFVFNLTMNPSPQQNSTSAAWVGKTSLNIEPTTYVCKLIMG